MIAPGWIPHSCEARHEARLSDSSLVPGWMADNKMPRDKTKRSNRSTKGENDNGYSSRANAFFSENY